VYEHDWKNLLEHEPIKHLIKQWKGGKVLANDKQYYAAVSGALKTFGPTAIMHYGSQHATTQTKVCKAPNLLLTVLWILRYTIYDERSHENLVKMLAPDTYHPPVGMNECMFQTVDFFYEYILVPVTDITIHMLKDDKSTKLKNIIQQHFVLRTEILWPRLKEFVIYGLASTFIDIIVKNGQNPDFTVKNDNTMGIKEFLDKNIDADNSKESSFSKSTNLYQLFFSALPHLIERHVKEEWQYIMKNFKWSTEQAATHFGQNATLQNFVFNLPIQYKEDGPYISLTLQDYFEAIRSGNVPLKELVGHQKSKNKIIVEGVDMPDTSKRTRNEVNYKEGDDGKEKGNKRPAEKKRTITMTKDKYLNLKHTIKFKSGKVIDAIGQHSTSWPEMYKHMGEVTSAAQKLFEMLDPAFPEDDSPKKKRSRKENM
jgi:hypothetical protein